MVVSTLDVSDAEETRRLLAAASKLAPVGGIFHLAMVMADKWIANQVGLPVASAVAKLSGSLLESSTLPWLQCEAHEICVGPEVHRVCRMNSAEYLSAALQTGEGWNTGVVPKAIGGQNLDAASRELPDLEHFVMFSSIVASSGNEGQCSSDPKFESLFYLVTRPHALAAIFLLPMS